VPLSCVSVKGYSGLHINLSAVFKSNQIYFTVAGNNNIQYKSIDLKYDIPLLKEWMVRQADNNTVPNLGP